MNGPCTSPPPLQTEKGYAMCPSFMSHTRRQTHKHNSPHNILTLQRWNQHNPMSQLIHQHTELYKFFSPQAIPYNCQMSTLSKPSFRGVKSTIIPSQKHTVVSLTINIKFYHTSHLYLLTIQKASLMQAATLLDY